MAYITDQVYYNNTSNHGSYQYVNLADIVRNYMFAYVGEGEAVDNVGRSKVLFHAKRSIQELNYDAARLYRVHEESVDSDLKIIMPHDYVDYVRISIEKNGILFPMFENRKPLSATAYLRDANNDLTFDGNGYVQETTAQLDTDRLAGDNTLEDDECCTYSIGAKYYLDPAEANVNPRFWVDRDAGVIHFNSEMDGELVVVEYISDGMQGGDDTLISIHKFFEEYIYADITYRILKSKRNIPKWEKDDSRRAKSALLRNANIRIGDFSGPKLLMTLRGKNKQIK